MIFTDEMLAQAKRAYIDHYDNFSESLRAALEAALSPLPAAEAIPSREDDEMHLIEIDEARAAAFRKAADWLSTKQAKAEQYPGGDLVHAHGRASAYQNAAQEIYGWEIEVRDALLQQKERAR